MCGIVIEDDKKRSG
jgi:hypothetical protein